MGNKLIYIAAAMAVAAILTSCDQNKVKVSGRIVGAESQTITMERNAAPGQTVADTTLTDAKGYFRFDITLPNGQSTIYDLRINDEAIPLFLSPGEKVSVNSFQSNIRNYSVEGSRESELMKEVNDILSGGAVRLDSIARVYSLYGGGSDEERRAGMTEYTREYNGIKRGQIEFIVRNSGSLAALYALYQRLPGDDILFNGDSDIVYYRMVADSVEKNYPDSPYLLTLRNAVNEYDRSQELARYLNEQMENSLPFPELNLPDIYGTDHKLSDLLGKVILVDFWVAGATESAVVNAEYRELYDKYSADGFEIYQVNAGVSKPAWVNAVLDQKLPWISVSDLRGASGPAPTIYNVRNLPANFIISRDGEIVGRGIYGDRLESEVVRLLRGGK